MAEVVKETLKSAVTSTNKGVKTARDVTWFMVVFAVLQMAAAHFGISVDTFVLSAISMFASEYLRRVFGPLVLPSE